MIWFVLGATANVLAVALIVFRFRWRFVTVRNAGGSWLYTDGGVHQIPEVVEVWKRT